MNLKNKKVLAIVAVVIVILLFIVIVVLKNIKDENDKLDKVMKKVEVSAELLEDNIETYNDNRNKLASLLGDYYSDMLVDDYDKYISILSEQEDTVKAIYTNVLELDKNCGDRLFSRKEINNTCNNYKDYYETVVNVYINDEGQVNDLIKSYNEDANNKLEEYHSKELVDYIDYNGDNKYLGRE